jgi:hypothetical protein
VGSEMCIRDRVTRRYEQNGQCMVRQAEGNECLSDEGRESWYAYVIPMNVAKYTPSEPREGRSVSGCGTVVGKQKGCDEI